MKVFKRLGLDLMLDFLKFLWTESFHRNFERFWNG